MIKGSSSLPFIARTLPSRVLIGYTSHCHDTVIDAVKSGVNVVIWSFIHFNTSVPARRDNEGARQETSVKSKPAVESNLDLDSIKAMKNELDAMGFDDVVHLVAFGGWNGPHLNTAFSAEELYESWKSYGGHIFDGFDWDLEGNDNISSPRNVMTVDCLERMGQMSELAKKDGYLVTMAPAESYLDITTSNFSRFLNLTYPNDDWHQEFSYHGANAYAYILAKWPDSIDLISVQFYESYSHAAYNIVKQGVSPSDYLINYVSQIFENGEGYTVDFDQDETVQLKKTFVEIPLNKLMIGLANGWADGEKTVYISPSEAGAAFETLVQKGTAPRGFMFWCIEQEAKDEYEFTRGLNEFLHIRSLSETIDEHLD